MQMRWDWRDVTCWLQSYVGHQARLSSCVLLFCLVQRERERERAGETRLGSSRSDFGDIEDRRENGRLFLILYGWCERGLNLTQLLCNELDNCLAWPLPDLMCAGALYLASSPLWLSRSQSGVTALSLRSLDIPPSLPVSSHTMCGGFCLRPDLSQVLAALDFTLIWNVIGIRLTYFLCQGLNFQLDF